MNGDEQLARLYDLACRSAIRSGATYAEAHLVGLRAVAETVRAETIHATRGAPS